MSSTNSQWRGTARITFGEALEARAAATLTPANGTGTWTGELLIEGRAPVSPGDRIGLFVANSPCTAIVRAVDLRGGAGHRTTNLTIEGEGRPPAPLR